MPKTRGLAKKLYDNATDELNRKGNQTRMSNNYKKANEYRQQASNDWDLTKRNNYYTESKPSGRGNTYDNVRMKQTQQNVMKAKKYNQSVKYKDSNEARQNASNNYDNVRRATMERKAQQSKAARDESRFNSSRSEARKAKVEASRQQSMLDKDNRANPTGDYTHYNALRNKRAAENLDRRAKKAQQDATKLINPGPNHPTSSTNPTAAGPGRGGKMDREWKNHKWTDRHRGPNGKWIYEYGPGSNSAEAKRQNAKMNLRAKEMSDKRSSRYKERAFRKGEYENALRKQKFDNFVRNASQIPSNAANAVSQATKAAGNFINSMANTVMNFFK